MKSIGKVNGDFKEVAVPDELKTLYFEGMDECVESFRVLKEITEFGERRTRRLALKTRERMKDTKLNFRRDRANPLRV